MVPSAPMSETAQVSAHFRTTAVRPGPLGLLREALTEMIGRRRLIAYLVQADMKKKGADTLLGNIWWVLDPLLQMVVYVVFVSVVLQRGGPDYPLFIFSAILPWKWFQTSVQDGITSVTSRSAYCAAPGCSSKGRSARIAATAPSASSRRWRSAGPTAAPATRAMRRAARAR